MRKFRLRMLVAWLCVMPAIASARQQAVEFSGQQWQFADRGAHLMTYMNRPSLFLDNGIAYVPAAAFADGVIEFDVAMHGGAGFAGVVFRGVSAGDYELIYLRTARSRQWDALQYTPIFNEQEAWQLYTGEGFNAAAELPANRWVHVRVEVDGYVARVFLDNASAPALTVRGLRRSWEAGFVGLWGRFGAANFSNFKFTRADRQTPSRPRAPKVPGAITRWELSASFDAKSVAHDRRLDDQGKPAQWQAVEAEPTGLLNIAEHRKLPDAERGVVFARTAITATAAERVRLSFGYSDDVTVLLNGRPVFAGGAAYLSRDGSYLGSLTQHDAVFLELNRGENELTFVVAERFGGWGLSVTIDPRSGVTIR